MNVGDLVQRLKISEYHPRDGIIGFVTAIKFCFDRGHPIVFVRFPKNGWGQWFHPTKLEVISESR